MVRVRLITTTSTIEGWEIDEYVGIVTHQIVIGANIFRDIFGGETKGYQKDLEEMEKLTIKALKNKTSNMNANIISGLRLGFDEVSGGGKSMFMLSASGTAAKGHPKNEDVNYGNSVKRVHSSALNDEIIKNELFKKIKEGNYKINSDDKIRELTKYRCQVTSDILQLLFNDFNFEYIPDSNILAEYFEAVGVQELNEFLASDDFISMKTDKADRVFKILKTIGWFNLEVINNLLSSDNQTALNRAVLMLKYEKESYEQNDIQILKVIAEKINSHYGEYPKYIVKKSTLGKEKKYWVCPNCERENKEQDSVCEHAYCKANIYGIPFNEVDPMVMRDRVIAKASKLYGLLINSIK